MHTTKSSRKNLRMVASGNEIIVLEALSRKAFERQAYPQSQFEQASLKADFRGTKIHRRANRGEVSYAEIQTSFCHRLKNSF